MERNQFKHCTRIQVRYKDVDKQGHVNNANHLTYFETARIRYFKDVFRTKIDWDKTGVILAHSEINYRIPILLEDDIYCYTRITKVGTKSFEINSILTKKENETETECANGKSVLVAFDYEEQKTVEVPDLWRERIKAFEQ